MRFWPDVERVFINKREHPINNDISNWWAPNDKALAGLCRAAGFSRVDAIVDASFHAAKVAQSSSLPRKLRTAAGNMLRKLSILKKLENESRIIRYRAMVQAWK